MARAKISGLDDIDNLFKGLEKLVDNIDEVADNALQAAAPSLKDALQDEIRSRTKKGYATGELAASIIATDTKVNGYGHFVAVKPTGTDSKGVRNGEKMAYLEYGTSKQAPNPVMAAAIHKAEPECAEKMQKELDKAINKYIGR